MQSSEFAAGRPHMNPQHGFRYYPLIDEAAMKDATICFITVERFTTCSLCSSNITIRNWYTLDCSWPRFNTYNRATTMVPKFGARAAGICLGPLILLAIAYMKTILRTKTSIDIVVPVQKMSSTSKTEGSTRMLNQAWPLTSWWVDGRE